MCTITYTVYICECPCGMLCVYGLEIEYWLLAQTRGFLLTVMRMYWDIPECFGMVIGVLMFLKP